MSLWMLALVGSKIAMITHNTAWLPQDPWYWGISFNSHRSQPYPYANLILSHPMPVCFVAEFFEPMQCTQKWEKKNSYCNAYFKNSRVKHVNLSNRRRLRTDQMGHSDKSKSDCYCFVISPSPQTSSTSWLECNLCRQIKWSKLSNDKKILW